MRLAASGSRFESGKWLRRGGNMTAEPGDQPISVLLRLSGHRSCGLFGTLMGGGSQVDRYDRTSEADLADAARNLEAGKSLGRKRTEFGSSQVPHDAADVRMNWRKHGPVAQLDRASDFGSEGWGFDSLRGRH